MLPFQSKMKCQTCEMCCFLSVFTVLGTSVYGGAILAGALDYFVERLLMVRWVWDRVSLRQSGEPCWFSWVLLSLWPGLLLFGLITQFTITGRGVHHQQCKNLLSFLLPEISFGWKANVIQIVMIESKLLQAQYCNIATSLFMYIVPVLPGSWHRFIFLL